MIRFLKANLFLAVAGALALLAVAAGRVPLSEVPGVEDGRLLLILLALILSVELVRDSGLLDRAVRRAVGRFRRARTLTFALLLATGVLAAFVTNDVALFVVIPFTVAAARHCDFRVRNAVILEVLAANLLGCLTPLGNPQNLFLSHQAGWTVGRFVATMLPFCLVCLALLALAVIVLEPARAIEPVHARLPPLKGAGALTGLVGLALVLLAVGHEISPELPALFAAAAAAAVLRRRMFCPGLLLIPLFGFVFIDMAALHSFDFAGLYARAPGPPDFKLFLAGALLPQVISNVPAAVLLAPLSAGRWRRLLYAVSAGGCGSLIASLANLLGWQIFCAEAGRDPVFFRRFSRVNFAFLALVGLAAYWLA